MPAINSRCRQPHKPSFLLLDSFRPVFRQVLKSCTFLFFMLSGLLKPHNHPSLIPFISENQPFPAYSLLSFRECSFYSLLVLRRDADFRFFVQPAHNFCILPSQIKSTVFNFRHRTANQVFKKWPDTGDRFPCPAHIPYFRYG